MGNNKTIGQRLRALRDRYKKSQKDVAQYLGIERTSYVKYENDKNVPPSAKVSQLAAYFNVTTDYILGTDKQPPALEKGLLPDNLGGSGSSHDDYSVTMSAREFLKAICKDSPEAVDIIDRMTVLDGEVDVTGINLNDNDIIQHQLKGLIMALKAAKIENGQARFNYTPDLPEGENTHD